MRFSLAEGCTSGGGGGGGGVVCPPAAGEARMIIRQVELSHRPAGVQCSSGLVPKPNVVHTAPPTEGNSNSNYIAVYIL